MSTTPTKPNPPTQPDPNNPSPFPQPPPPTPALRSVMDLSPAEQQEALLGNADHPHHHFWKKFFDDLGNAIGEAKFGG